MPPDRVLAEHRDEGYVCLVLDQREARRQRLRSDPDARRSGLNRRRRASGLDQDQLRLTRVDQLEIDLGEQFRATLQLKSQNSWSG